MPNYTPDGEIIIEPVDFEDTEVRLLSVPLESDYKHTLYFNNPESQERYFKRKTMLTLTESSYQRKDYKIMVQRHIDDLWLCNYVMYKNKSYSNKWFYSFITDMKYIHDELTEITFETDVIQTWLFDYVVQPSFVEREHVKSDDIGANTYPENVETGEFIVNDHYEDDVLQDLSLVIGVTAKPDGTKVGGGNYDGIYSGVQYLYCSANKPSVMTSYLNEYDEEGRANAIQCIFLAPKFLTDDQTPDTIKTLPNDINTPETYQITREKPNGIDYYVPRNKKLLTYPYRFLTISNNNGASAIYRYENFIGDEMTFEIHGAICPGCSIRLIPLAYKNDTYMDDEGINLGKFPICNWQTDVYTNWLTQNSVNIGVGVAGGLLGAVGSLASGNIGGAIVTGVGAIGGTIGQVYQQSFQAPQVQGNINCGDVVTATQKNTFHFYDMSIKEEYARIIDDYFDMFGYKVCRVKTPNKAHRETWWYTKTIDVNIDGAIPMKDMLKIKSCYNNGLTFWQDTTMIGNYNASNEIVTVIEGE